MPGESERDHGPHIGGATGCTWAARTRVAQGANVLRTLGRERRCTRGSQAPYAPVHHARYLFRLRGAGERSTPRPTAKGRSAKLRTDLRQEGWKGVSVQLTDRSSRRTRKRRRDLPEELRP